MGVKKSGLELVMKNAVAVLKAGGVVVFPTETSYGIGCDATNAEAVRRVFEIKGRPEGKGTPLIVDSFKTAERWGVFSPLAQTLAQKYWPGPLTIVVPATGDGRVAGRDSLLRIAPAVLQDNTVALRISSHPVARELAKRLGRPLIATSANRSGEPPAYSIRAFLSQIHHSAPDPIPLLTKEGLGVVEHKQKTGSREPDT